MNKIFEAVVKFLSGMSLKEWAGLVLVLAFIGGLTYWKLLENKKALLEAQLAVAVQTVAVEQKAAVAEDKASTVKAATKSAIEANSIKTEKKANEALAKAPAWADEPVPADLAALLR